MINERNLVGLIFGVVGIIVMLKGRIRLEDTDIFLNGVIAKIAGLLFIALGIYLLVF
jgi:drug/metabolite transporter (DMT)-like permease